MMQEAYGIGHIVCGGTHETQGIRSQPSGLRPGAISVLKGLVARHFQGRLIVATEWR